MRARVNLILAVVASALALVVLAACGDDDGGGGGSSESIGAQGGSAADEAKAAAEKDAQDPVPLPKQTLGFLQFTEESEVARRIEDGAKKAAAALGWDFIVCDGQGDPREIGRCGTTLLNQNADVILANSADPTVVRSALLQAKRDGVPWFTVGNVNPSPLIAGIYAAVPDAELATAIDEFFFDALGSDGEKKVLVTGTYPGLEAVNQRHETFLKDAKQHPNVKVVATEDLDYTNPIEDTRRSTLAVLTQHPDLAGIWVAQDAPAVPAADAVTSKGLTGEDRPIITAFYGDFSILDKIRKGEITATVESPLEAGSWVALDQAAQLIGRDAEPLDDPQSTYSLDFLQPVVVTKENVPKKPNTYPEPAGDFVTYFTEKWNAEFESEQ